MAMPTMNLRWNSSIYSFALSPKRGVFIDAFIDILTNTSMPVYYDFESYLRERNFFFHDTKTLSGIDRSTIREML